MSGTVLRDRHPLLGFIPTTLPRRCIIAAPILYAGKLRLREVRKLAIVTTGKPTLGFLESKFNEIELDFQRLIAQRKVQGGEINHRNMVRSVLIHVQQGVS